MERRHWKTAAAAALLLLTTRVGFAQDSTPAAVLVAVHDSARVPQKELADAQTLAASVFATAGVRVEWKAPGGACGTEADAKFCVQVLLRSRNPQSAPGSRRIMGVALAADLRRAVLSLYFDAVTTVARQYGSPRGHVLGLALAHEMGHVLLPPPSHSATGIMQPSWEGDDIRHVLAGDTTFTDAQVLAMRARLASRQ